MTYQPTALFHLRKARAFPPGHAREDARAETFDAALHQFEELLASARKVGAASRPLPLFYALSQAGRAIVCAGAGEAEPWRLYGHGLSAPALSGPLLDVRIAVPRWVPTKDSVSSFQGVAQLLHDQRPRSAVSIGDVWTSLPEVAPLLDSSAHPGYRRPVLVVPDDPNSYTTTLFPWGRVDLTVVGLDIQSDGTADDLANAVLQELRHYRRAGMPRWRLHRPQGTGPSVKQTEAGCGFWLSMDAKSPNLHGHEATLRQLSSDSRGFALFPLRPNLARANVSRIGRWWMLLFALSMLARYEPAGWTATLNPRSSVLAAPLEELLNVAVETLPEVVLQVLEATRSS